MIQPIIILLFFNEYNENNLNNLKLKIHYFIVKKYLFSKISKFRFEKINLCAIKFFLGKILKINKSLDL
jgi:hypothetical protein